MGGWNDFPDDSFEVDVVMKFKGKNCVAADLTDIARVEMKQLLEQYFMTHDLPVVAKGPVKEMVWSWFSLMGQVMGNLELVALRAKHKDVVL